MSYEEKGTWVYLVTSAGAYAVYLAIVLGRLASVPAGLPRKARWQPPTGSAAVAARLYGDAGSNSLATNH